MEGRIARKCVDINADLFGIEQRSKTAKVEKEDQQKEQRHEKEGNSKKVTGNVNPIKLYIYARAFKKKK